MVRGVLNLGRGGARLVRAVAGATAALIVLGVSAGGAGAAGVTTHAFMAQEAIPLVQSSSLHALLIANSNAVLSGAHYPDGGYAIQTVPGANYSEVSHWERFIDAATV